MQVMPVCIRHTCTPPARARKQVMRTTLACTAGVDATHVHIVKVEQVPSNGGRRPEAHVWVRVEVSCVRLERSRIPGSA